MKPIKNINGSGNLAKFKRLNSTNSINSKFKYTDLEFYQWFVGFTDAEGCFYIKIGVKQIQFRFSIHLHLDDLPVLQNIQNHFKAGNIYIQKTSASWEVTKKDEILKLFDIFDIICLNTTKRFNYLDFKEAFLLYNSRSEKNFHAVPGLLEKISFIKDRMNSKRIFNNSETRDIEISPNWLLGFTEGDGSFFVRLNKFELNFSLAQADFDLLLFNHIKEYLLRLPLNINNLKNIYVSTSSTLVKNEKKDVVHLKISDTTFLNEIIIPFFKNLQFLTKKGKDFSDWVTIMKIKNLSLHKTEQGKELITELANRMNDNRLSTNLKNQAISESSRIDLANNLDAKIEKLFDRS